MTYDVLAAQVSLSASGALRRVKRLEDAGVIAGYVALVAPERVGLGLTAYLNVRLEKHTESPQAQPDGPVPRACRPGPRWSNAPH